MNQFNHECFRDLSKQKFIQKNSIFLKEENNQQTTIKKTRINILLLVIYIMFYLSDIMSDQYTYLRDLGEQLAGERSGSKNLNSEQS